MAWSMISSIFLYACLYLHSTVFLTFERLDHVIVPLHGLVNVSSLFLYLYSTVSVSYL
jgi:hypothetical protein